MSCNKITNHIVHKEDEAIWWKLKRIVSHEGLNIVYHPNSKLSWYNVMVEWYKIENTIEPLSTIAVDDPFIYDLYAYGNQ